MSEREFLDTLYREFPRMRGRRVYILVTVGLCCMILLLSLIYLQDAGTLQDGLTQENLAIISGPLWVGAFCIVFIVCFYIFSIKRTYRHLELNNSVDSYKVMKEFTHGQMNWSNPIILTKNYIVSRRAGIHVIDYRNIKTLHTYTTTNHMIPISIDIMVELTDGGIKSILSVSIWSGGRKRVNDIINNIHYKQKEQKMGCYVDLEKK